MVHTEESVNTARSDSVVRLTLIVSFLWLTAPLVPADLQPTLCYTMRHTTSHAQTISTECCCDENSFSPDEVLPQGKWHGRECHALFCPFLLSVSLQKGAARPPARPPVLVALHSFPRKIPSGPALDDPFLS